MIITQCTICTNTVDGYEDYLRHIRICHGNDRNFCSICPACQSTFTYTNWQSFTRHVRKTHLSKPVFESLSSTNIFDDYHVSISNEFENQNVAQSSSSALPPDSLEEIRRLFIKMLLQVREGHILPGVVMNTVSSSCTSLLHSFMDGLLPELAMSTNDERAISHLQQVQRILCDVSRNEQTFISACEHYFGLVKPIELRLPTESKAYYVPITKVLQLLFGKDDFHEAVKMEKEKIEVFRRTDILYHYRCGELAKRHPVLSNKDKNCILIQLYVDDLGVVNPLMGRSSVHKLTAVYFSIDDLPRQHNSSLSVVHLVLLCLTKDIEEERNRHQLFSKLASDLNILENDGLTLSSDSTVTYFTLSTMCADNLAAHQLGGFMASFNSGKDV
ncbi:unnamed protein product [Didymodactylos carnosus]|uniref:C2H2-type domain-containing protein n=1 Tax=Didymodactylos carnosus TaxID=1234261 RepID=A0A8S2ED75_9BILA|nr:unnamed protein product [Didymodactylos carnosus]CAF4003404.1 unnamed protein product [Didymodactylos carnosus]